MAFTTDEWEAATSFPEYLEGVEAHRELWHHHWESTEVPEGIAARLADLPGPRRVLVLTEDWCGDAARIVPVLAAVCEAAGGRVEHRYLESDDHPETIGRYLTHGGRAIPLAVVHDEHGACLGTWGPRPAALTQKYRWRALFLTSLHQRCA